LFEGFGLPPFEALALGCPVVSSNIPVLREILGDEISCFNPYNVDDIALNMEKVLANNSFGENLVKKGSSILNNFSKDKIIKEYITIFNDIKDTSK